MSADRHVSPRQLAMFMTPKEIHAEFKASLIDLPQAGGDQERMYALKLQESEDAGMAEHIRQHGVKDPIHLYHDPVRPYVRNGQHRLAVATAHDPDKLVPVWHSDDSNYAGPPYDPTLPGVHYR